MSKSGQILYEDSVLERNDQSGVFFHIITIVIFMFACVTVKKVMGRFICIIKGKFHSLRI